ncbi:hypothetical protein [Sodalis sp.]|uniref:hypothetical protein n=1 Tax=Sodalis sp. (in: enterobacteria) TaxID=1898979 RepID=UPI0038730F17
MNRTLSAIVYVILFLMGIKLGAFSNLAGNVLRMGVITAVSALCILVMNALALAALGTLALARCSRAGVWLSTCSSFAAW